MEKLVANGTMTYPGAKHIKREGERTSLPSD